MRARISAAERRRFDPTCVHSMWTAATPLIIKGVSVAGASIVLASVVVEEFEALGFKKNCPKDRISLAVWERLWWGTGAWGQLGTFQNVQMQRKVGKGFYSTPVDGQ